MVKEIRREIIAKLDDKILDRIKKAPKPTKVAEALAVAKEMAGMSLSLGEIAEVINIAEPGRNIKAAESDYTIADLKRHPSLLITTTPQGCFVRFTGGRNIYE